MGVEKERVERSASIEKESREREREIVEKEFE